MKKIFIFLILTAVIPLTDEIYAAPNCDILSFSCYEEHVQDFCNSPDLAWVSGGEDLGSLVPSGLEKCSYPEYTPNTNNKTIQCIETWEQSDILGIKDGVSMASIGAYGGFRGIELARLLYRKNMNNIFSCAVIASRSAKLDALNTILSGKQGATEIQRSIEKERVRYKDMKTQMNCDLARPENSSRGVVDRAMRSSMKEYCKYSYYLDYLDENLRRNVTVFSTTETKIGDGNKSKSANDTEKLKNELTSRGQVIEEERIRANEVLPKAITAFQEMDRTYIVHIMLVFIYDDYMRLRNQLNTYLTAIGQTFEKGYNAQDSN